MAKYNIGTWNGRTVIIEAYGGNDVRLWYKDANDKNCELRYVWAIASIWDEGAFHATSGDNGPYNPFVMGAHELRFSAQMREEGTFPDYGAQTDSNVIEFLMFADSAGMI